MADRAPNEPLKLTHIQDMLNSRLQQMTPSSLAFMLAPETRGIPEVPAGFDPRRLPFNDIPMQLRDQRQYSLANPPQNNPFSAFGAVDNLNRMTNTLK